MAVDRNAVFKTLSSFWFRNVFQKTQLLETHKKGSQHFRLSRCLKKKVVARYTIRSIGTSVFKNFWFFGFSYSRRTKKVPNTFVYLVVWKKSSGTLYNWIAVDRNVRFQKFLIFWTSISLFEKKSSGTLYNWIAVDRNVRFQKFLVFWTQLLKKKRTLYNSKRFPTLSSISLFEKKSSGTLYNWIAVDRNVRFQKFLVF